MGILYFITIILFWLLLDHLLRKKWGTPKRSGYRHERKFFLILFYLIIIGFGASVVFIDQMTPIYLFPFTGSLVNILFFIEKFLYRKTDKLYIHYLNDAFFWLILGVAAYFIF